MKIFFLDRTLIALFLLAVLIRALAFSERLVERWYSNGVYPVVSKAMRTVTGWLPFSVGDWLYVAAALWLVRKAWRFITLVRQKRLRREVGWVTFRKYVKTALVIYTVFQTFWGLNYSRQGIAPQLGMDVQAYTPSEAMALTAILQRRLNSYAASVDSAKRTAYNNNSLLFQNAVASYQTLSETHPFLTYGSTSLKPSLFTAIGHYFGFTGYYNPFTAEAQIKTSIPVFLKPFVATHEMAHQLGYAKENEASFVGYLACEYSTDVQFIYSGYFEVYREALAVCRAYYGKGVSDSIAKGVHPRVRQDLADLRQYLISVQNPVEPFVSGAYDKYLKLNNQPKGKGTYNEVVGHLIAYTRKFGAEAL